MVLKWRPTLSDCFYIVPDIRGASELLNNLIKNVLPLRKSEGIKDKILFLGNYIGNSINSHKVLDTLIELKSKYKDKIITLFGSNEWLFLKAIEEMPLEEYEDLEKLRKIWLESGGYEIISGYLERNNIKGENIYSIPFSRIKSLLPKEHINFLKELINYYEFNNYLFVHAGLDLNIPLENQPNDSFIWNRTLLQNIKNNELISFDKVIITGHHYSVCKTPIITDKYMMLDVGAPDQLIMVELNTMQSYIAYYNQRLVKYKLEEFIIDS